MKNKYNLALIPTSKSDIFIKLSQQFTTMADQYLLGKKSLPHITLRHFEAEENEINFFWEEAKKQVKTIHLDLSTYSYTTTDHHTYWISLLPNKQDALTEMQEKISNILKLPNKNNYDPHLTLLNTKNNHYYDEIITLSKSFEPINDSFILSLGKSDKIGQYLGTIKK